MEYPKSRDDYAPLGDSRIFSLEYESYLDVGGDSFVPFDGVKMIVTMRSQRDKNLMNLVPAWITAPSSSLAMASTSTSSTTKKELSKSE